MNKQYLLAILFSMALIFSGCSSDDPEPVNEEEVITTVRVTFTGTGNTSGTVLATFQDLDGPGGDAPVLTNPTLMANGTYDVSVEFLNETETPAEDITEEVSEEADEHQIFITPASGLNFTYAYNDEDGAGNPIGLDGTVTTGDASTGNLVLVLRHEPNKDAAGVSDGDITNAGGETDVSVTFNVTIQ